MGGKTDFEKLTQGNYEDWAPIMEALLVDKDVWDVIEGDGPDGEVEVPLGGPNSKVVRAFRRKQQVARANIILHVDKSQLPHTRFSTPKEIWDELKRVHRSYGFASLLALRRHFFTMKKQPNQSIQSWAADVRHAVYLLERAAFTVDELDKILALTQGLPEEYGALIVALDAGSVDQLTFESVLDRLLNEESRQKLATLTLKDEPDSAMAVTRRITGGANKKPGLQGVRCHRCQGFGHMRASCPTREEDAAHVVEDTDHVATALSAVELESDSDCSF